ncbi:MAG TPA: gephyrin-like molybdotransferase Glp, partial [Kofleriaceae bacterium]|nr:gephyrin-like molybdotransferase Glp [Kofleriaceae bacterium]
MKSVDEATRAIRAAVKPLGAERVKLAAARGRIIAAPVFAGRALPPWDNSAMDGFAVRANEVPGTLPIAATIAAGTSPTAGLAPGTCARIMTGAPVPDGADAVIMREDAEVVDGGGRVAFAQPVNPGQHIRRAGGDIAPGDRALCAGTEMDAPAIGLLAALGHDRVDVARKPAVAIISTGDELIEVGQDLGPGQIYSSNNHALAAQIDEAGGIPIDLGIAPDNLEAISASFERARSADIIVTSGGVSVGDFDFVRDALAAIGAQVAFWKVAIKPGKPLVFGTAPPATLIFGLPGNPVSSMVTFELFVRPVIRAMLG